MGKVYEQRLHGVIWVETTVDCVIAFFEKKLRDDVVASSTVSDEARPTFPVIFV